MGRRRKHYEKIISGTADANIPFEQTRTLLKYLGFSEHIAGDHYIYRREGIPGRLNLQPQKAEAKCKPYQVRQIRQVLLDYDLEP